MFIERKSLFPRVTDIAGFTHGVTAINKDTIRTINVTLTVTNPAPCGGLPLRIPDLPGAVSGVNFSFAEYGKSSPSCRNTVWNTFHHRH